MKALALIPARGGSVTLPRKNVLPFCDKPLIAYSIETALSAKQAGAPIDRLIVSTEDLEIAQISRCFGAEVPFMRPAALAQPDTPTLPVVRHAVEHAEQELQQRYDWVLLLQPTSPLRSIEDVLSSLEIAARLDTTAVISVTSANSSNPTKLRLIEQGYIRPYLGNKFEQKRRQDFTLDVYRTNGAIYLTCRNALMEESCFYGSHPRPLIMPPERSIDIDTRLDFEIAEFLYRRHAKGKA